jgi:hypothetical protein
MLLCLDQNRLGVRRLQAPLLEVAWEGPLVALVVALMGHHLVVPKQEHLLEPQD